MLEIAILLMWFFMFLGVYLISLDLFKVPTKKASTTLLKYFKQGIKKTTIAEVTVTEISQRLSKYIYINKYKKSKLKNTLHSAKIKISPELYIARALTKGMLLSACAIPTYLVYPKVSILFVVLGIYKYYEEVKYAEKIVEKNKKVIEYELPRMCATINQELKQTRNIIAILENFKGSVCDTFKEELEITIADMRTGNRQKALLNFEKRINSTMLSEITRGLIGIENGDNNITYFEMLSYNLKKVEELNLEGEAMKVPKKIKKYSLLVFVACACIFFVAVGLQLIKSMNAMF